MSFHRSTLSFGDYRHPASREPFGGAAHATRSLALAAVLLACGGGPALAQGTTAPHPCALVPDAPQRLACYDRAFPPPPATRAAATAQAEARFGLPASAPLAPTVPPPSTLRTTVVETARHASGDRVFILDNGQRWRQLDRAQLTHVAPGERVEIEPAALGGFRLVTAAGVGIRVRRLP